MTELSTVMEQIRASTTTEGGVIYLERSDDVAVGLVKIKNDHYVIARRTRETMRSALVDAIHKNRCSLDEAQQTVEKRLKAGMKELTHVGGCSDHHQDWALHASKFAKSWAAAYRGGNANLKK